MTLIEFLKPNTQIQNPLIKFYLQKKKKKKLILKHMTVIFNDPG